MGRSQGEKGLAVSLVITNQTGVTVYIIIFPPPEIQTSGSRYLIRSCVVRYLASRPNVFRINSNLSLNLTLVHSFRPSEFPLSTPIDYFDARCSVEFREPTVADYTSRDTASLGTNQLSDIFNHRARSRKHRIIGIFQRGETFGARRACKSRDPRGPDDRCLENYN